MDDLVALLEPARHWRVRHPARHVIYDEGEPSSAIFRVEAGCVRLQVNGPEGGRQILAFLFPGDVFGVCTTERATSAEAVTAVELTRYSLASVLRRAGHTPDLVVRLLESSNTLFNGLAHHVERLGHPAPERLLLFLTWVAQRLNAGSGEAFKLPMSMRDVADFLAVSPETLSRLLRDLQARGLLALRGRRAVALRHPRSEHGGAEAPEDDQRRVGLAM